MDRGWISRVARLQGVSRQAISQRLRNGWSEEEVERGERSGDRFRFSEEYGRSARELSEELGVSLSRVYGCHREGTLRFRLGLDVE